MKTFLKKFCLRGMSFAWMGPVIMAIVYLCIKSAGNLDTLTVEEVALGVITSTIMAFVAAGITVIYQMENLPMSFVGLIHMAILYIDYMGIYLLNGWLPAENIWIFTLIFVAGFILIWFAIYISIRAKVNKMNQKMHL